jgi:prophage DNA circulation protein
MADIFEQFLECSWRGISFPTQSVEAEISHDLAVHKKIDRDGANVEATGRNPTVYTVKALFLNTIAKGPMETWSNLFPDTYNKFIDAVEDRSVGDFVHPFHGSRRCHIQKVSESFAAQTRGGPSITIQIIETDEGADSAPLSSTSNIAIIKSAAIDLDTYIKQLNPPPNSGIEELGFDSFSDFADSLSSAVGSVELFQNKIASKINGVVNSVNKIASTVDKAATLTTTNPITGAIENTQKLGAGIVKIIDASNKLTLALLGVQNNPFTIQKTLKLYTVLADTTISRLAAITKNKLSDLVKLNPGILKELIVTKGTVIRYYK